MRSSLPPLGSRITRISVIGTRCRGTLQSSWFCLSFICCKISTGARSCLTGRPTSNYKPLGRSMALSLRTLRNVFLPSPRTRQSRKHELCYEPLLSFRVLPSLYSRWHTRSSLGQIIHDVKSTESKSSLISLSSTTCVYVMERPLQYMCVCVSVCVSFTLTHR